MLDIPTGALNVSTNSCESRYPARRQRASHGVPLNTPVLLSPSPLTPGCARTRAPAVCLFLSTLAYIHQQKQIHHRQRLQHCLQQWRHLLLGIPYELRYKPLYCRLNFFRIVIIERTPKRTAQCEFWRNPSVISYP